MFIAWNSRHDILYAVNYISHFQNMATPTIFKYAKRILRYFVSTIDLCTIFQSNGTNPIASYVDAAFADCKDDEHQWTSGFMILSYNDLIF